MTDRADAEVLRYDRKRLVEVLVYHWRTDNAGCGCGWGELGRSHAEHVANVYEDYLEAAADWPDSTDVQIDTFRGGKTAVRVTHLPTGLMAMSDEQDSIIKAKEQALERLREAHRGR